VLLVVSVGACIAVGADRPANSALLPNAQRSSLDAHSSRTSRVAGFGQVGFRVVMSDVRKTPGPLRCALLADTPPARARGMTGRRDLAGYQAMVFRFSSDSTTPFFNKGVPIPLSIAWFDAAGVLVGTADLAVCPVTCPTFAPVTPYRLALEVPRGGLHRLGVSTGSVLLVGGSCAA
jgi:uncharacterized membrane protein (UPF0127 family)